MHQYTVLVVFLGDAPGGPFISLHNDVIKWKHLPRYWPLYREFTGPGEFPAQRPVTQSFEVSFDLHQNKRLTKQSWGWWFETLSHPLWRHRNGSRGAGGYEAPFFNVFNEISPFFFLQNSFETHSHEYDIHYKIGVCWFWNNKDWEIDSNLRVFFQLIIPQSAKILSKLYITLADQTSPSEHSSPVPKGLPFDYITTSVRFLKYQSRFPDIDVACRLWRR